LVAVFFAFSEDFFAAGALDAVAAGALPPVVDAGYACLSEDPVQAVKPLKPHTLGAIEDGSGLRVSTMKARRPHHTHFTKQDVGYAKVGSG
jgi:hypothetical protein